MNRVSFAALLIVLIIGCSSGGFIASYYLNGLFFSVAEPYAYPCIPSDEARPCTDYGHDYKSYTTSVWFYSWPGVDPTHIHYQPQRSCIADFLYHEPLPPGTLRGQRK